VNFPGRSHRSRGWGDGFIAVVSAYCEHKSWAVKLLAYTLDRTIICASALQQKPLFPQVMGITLFSVFGMVWAVRQRARPFFNPYPFRI
jgi:hypothetical protein